VNSQLQAPAAFFPEKKYPFTYCVGEWEEFEAVLKAEDRFDISLVAGNGSTFYRVFIRQQWQSRYASGTLMTGPFRLL